MDAASSWGFPKAFGDGGILGGGPLPYVLAPLAILMLGLLLRWAWLKVTSKQRTDR